VDGKFAEPRHITVRLFQRGENVPEESPYADYIRDGMKEKYNVDVEFAVSGRWTEPAGYKQIRSSIETVVKSKNR
jgi:hypothetical protein